MAGLSRATPVGALRALAASLVVACGTPAPAASPAEPVPATGDEDTSNRSLARCTGDVDVAAAIAEIRRFDGAMRDCYEAELRSDREWQVTLRVAITLHASGEIDTIGFDPVGHPTFEMCVPATLGQASFPPVTGGDCAVLLVPYVFTPSPT